MTSRLHPPPAAAPSLSPPVLGGDEEWREKVARWTQMASHIRSRVAQLATAQAHPTHAQAANYSMHSPSPSAPVMLTHAQLAQQAQTLKAQIQQIDREIEVRVHTRTDDSARSLTATTTPNSNRSLTHFFLSSRVQSARAEALDDPALLESEQERRMHTIEQHATAMSESVPARTQSNKSSRA